MNKKIIIGIIGLILAVILIIFFINNKNKEVSVFSSSIYDYYNPYQNGEVIDDNPWVGYSIDLNNNAEFLIKSYN